MLRAVYTPLNQLYSSILTPDLILDPEVIFFIDYLADEDGWAHSMQSHPDGYAHYLRHHPAELDKGVRWMCRTPDQDALGLYLPATAEHQGYLKAAARDLKSAFNMAKPLGEYPDKYRLQNYLSDYKSAAKKAGISDSEINSNIKLAIDNSIVYLGKRAQSKAMDEMEKLKEELIPA